MSEHFAGSDDGPVMVVMGPCGICGKIMSFHPLYVPSMRLGPPENPGPREPICQSCFDHINDVRARYGLALNVLNPRAYDIAQEGEF